MARFHTSNHKSRRGVKPPHSHGVTDSIACLPIQLLVQLKPAGPPQSNHSSEPFFKDAQQLVQHPCALTNRAGGHLLHATRHAMPARHACTPCLHATPARHATHGHGNLERNDIACNSFTWRKLFAHFLFCFFTYFCKGYRKAIPIKKIPQSKTMSQILKAIHSQAKNGSDTSLQHDTS